jgi:hypothetical protein
MLALPIRYAFMVPAAIHMFNVLVERQVSLEAARTPTYPGRERSSSIVLIRVNTRRTAATWNME